MVRKSKVGIGARAIEVSISMACPFHQGSGGAPFCPSADAHDSLNDDEFFLEEAVTNSWVIRHCGMGALVDQLGAELFGLCSIGETEKIREMFAPRFSKKIQFLLKACVFIFVTCCIMHKGFNFSDIRMRF